MKLSALLILLAASYIYADPNQFKMQIEKCRGETNEAVCVAKVLVEQIDTNVVHGGGTGNIYCRCVNSGSVQGKNRLIRVTPENPFGETIGEDLEPRDCVQALRFHPCI